MRTRGVGLKALCLALFGCAAVTPAAVSLEFLEGFEATSLQHVQLRVLAEHFDATAGELETAAALETPEEMAAAFFLARQSDKSVARVVRKRRSGATWWEVMEKVGVTFGALHRGMAWQLKAEGEKDFRTPGPLSDLEVERLVSIQVTAQYFRTSTTLVAQALGSGQRVRDLQYAFYRMGRAPRGTAGASALEIVVATEQDRFQSLEPPQRPVRRPADRPARAQRAQRYQKPPIE